MANIIVASFIDDLLRSASTAAARAILEISSSGDVDISDIEGLVAELNARDTANRDLANATGELDTVNIADEAITSDKLEATVAAEVADVTNKYDSSNPADYLTETEVNLLIETAIDEEVGGGETWNP